MRLSLTQTPMRTPSPWDSRPLGDPVVLSRGRSRAVEVVRSFLQWVHSPSLTVPEVTGELRTFPCRTWYRLQTPFR
jgi:hypothetical protein